MSGVIIEPFTSVEAAERNFTRLNEAIVALQGGSIAIENIEGYENLATKLEVEKAIEAAIEKIQYKVGDVHISESETNPAEKFGYGTWALISQGRALVGVDDKDNDFKTPAKTGGEKTHKLTIDEMPKHAHPLGTTGVHRADGGSQTGLFAVYDLDYSGERQTKTAGGDKEHNNLQPYYCVYIWKRTK